MTASEGGVAARVPPGGQRRQLHGVDGGIDDELALGRHLARLLEETERKARRDAEADVLVAPALRRRPAVGGDLRALRRDLEEEAPLVGGLSGAEILDLDRVRGHATLVIEDLDLDEVRPPDLSAQRKPADDGEVAQAELAHEPAHDDEREEHAEQQVEEVVAGVDGREADAERDADEELPFARELQLPRRPPTRPAGAGSAKVPSVL